MAGNDNILEQVIDVLEGRVSSEAAQNLLDRVAGDPELQRVHAWVTEFLMVSATSTLQAPPAATRAMLESLLAVRPSLADTVKDAFRSFATLVRDVPVGAAFAGARGVAGTRRQLMFDLGNDTDLALELDVRSDGVVITGQVLGTEPARTVDFIGDHPALTVTTDELGEFSAALPATSFLHLDLTTATGHATVDLTPFLDPHDQEPR